MGIKSVIAKPLARWMRGRILQEALNADQNQKNCLLQLVRGASQTQYGLDHQFNEIKDYNDFVARNPIHEYEDLLQISGAKSRSRGHQGPGAFLVMGSGLDKHGIDSEKKLPYSHIDIAGSSGDYPGYPSARPLPSFFLKYILPRI